MRRLLLFALPLLAACAAPPSADPPAPAESAAPGRTPIDVSALGPQVGEPVPDFSLIDQNGTARSRDALMGPKGLMLVFIRSADW
jgi:hypothetical protein